MADAPGAVRKVAIIRNSDRLKDEIRKGLQPVMERELALAKAYAIRLATNEISEDELRKNKRGQSRRNLAVGKPRYRDSFKITIEVNDRHRLRLELVNTHPAAHILERGSRAHQIPLQPKTTSDRVVFPGGEGAFWKLNGPPWVFATQVNHPGTPAYKIMNRTAAAIRARRTR